MLIFEGPDTQLHTPDCMLLDTPFPNLVHQLLLFDWMLLDTPFPNLGTTPPPEIWLAYPMTSLTKPLTIVIV